MNAFSEIPVCREISLLHFPMQSSGMQHTIGKGIFIFIGCTCGKITGGILFIELLHVDIDIKECNHYCPVVVFGS